MKAQKLKAETRKTFGHKVKALRREGKLPASIYGNKFKSVSVSVNTGDFEKVYKESGETGLIELSDGKDTHPVLIHNIHVHPVTDQILHIEFLRVNLKEKVKSNVPLEFTGQAPAIEQGIGILLTSLNEIEVEALPTELPDKIEVDISNLKEVDNAILVSDLKVPQGVNVLTLENLDVVRITPLVKKEEEKPPEEEEEVKEGEEEEVAEEGEKVQAQDQEEPKEDESKKEDQKDSDRKKEQAPKSS